MSRAFPEAEIVADGPGVLSELESLDGQLPLGSLPRWWRRSRDSFRSSGVFLSPTAEQAARWRARFDALGGDRKVGICWRSGLVTPERRRYYAPAEEWGSLWRVPGVTWINLQYDDCEAELAAIEAATGVRVHRWNGEDLKNDLESVVGLLSQLDAVVSAPTAVSSLAGATGIPTWQLDSGSDWTVFGADRSPWWPSIRLERKRPGEATWESAVRRLAARLGEWISMGQENGR